MRWKGLFALIAARAAASSTPLSIEVATGWPAPPPLLEYLETLTDLYPQSYHPFLHYLVSFLKPTPEPRTAQETHEIVMSITSDFGIPGVPQEASLSLYKLALGMHTAVPRIEAAYSWYANNINEKAMGVEECGSWVEWRGKGFCAKDELRRDAEMSIEAGEHHDEPKKPLLPFDRASNGYEDAQSQAVFYLDPTTGDAEPLLTYLIYHVNNSPSFGYTVRYKPPKERSTGARTGLSGYGVELALKNTDYLVVDDRTSQTTSSDKASIKDSGSSRGFFSEILGNDPWTELSTPLSKQELQDIGLKAASLILSSEDKLSALQHLSQDFPKYSAALARKVKVSQSIKEKLSELLAMGPMAPAVYFNGKPFARSELDAFTLLKILREETDHVMSLTELGLTPRQAFELISDSLIGQAQTEDDPGEGTVDASDQLEEGEAIVWWNNIEKDSRYKSWPSSINGYLRPIYPGQLHTIRKNTWNLVFVLDMSSAPSLDVIANSISTMIQRGLPIRFGIVPMISTDDDGLSLTMAKVFFYSVKTFGRGLTKELLANIVGQTPGTPAVPGVISLSVVKQTYDMIADMSKKPALPFNEMLASFDSDSKLEANRNFTSRLLATKEESPTGHLFVNGRHTPMSGQWPAFVQQELTNQLQFVAEQIANGAEFEDMSRIFYDLHTTPKRRSKYLLPGLNDNKLKVYSLPKLFSNDHSRKLDKEFVYNPDKTRGAPITMWIIGDLDSSEGQAMINDALTHVQQGESASRLGFVHIPNPASAKSDEIRLSTLLYILYMESSLHTIHPNQLQALIKEFSTAKDNLDTDANILSEESQKAFENTPLHAFSAAGWGVGDTAAAAQFWSNIGKSFAKELELKSSLPHLLINGRLVGPIKPGTLEMEDFDLFEMYELRKRTKPVIDLLKTMYHDITAFDRATLANLISSASSIIASAYAPSNGDGIFAPTAVGRNRFYEKADRKGVLSFTIGNTETALVHVVAVVDPISENAQQWSSMLQTLKNLDNVAVSVYLQPQPVTTELGLKRFYRFALSPETRFDVDGNEVYPGVTFTDLPSAPILTLAMDTPPSWILRPESSPHDLDNLVLGSNQEPIHIHFNLNQLLIEGHAREANNAPPRGLQLQLTTEADEAISDTQVMANLGYFQFKAAPGVYQLAIRPGRGTEVYELESVGAQGWDSPGVNVTGTVVALTSLEGATILPRFERKPGMELENVLVEAAPVVPSYAGSVVSRMKELVGLAKPETTQVATRHAEINIFTVASGLLYERFASIMILSVMKNTKSTVKFWFIENFLSPTFLEFVPQMAEEYGFQYEFVTYKWPHWLRAQTEKQRIIWAYKILFLDVLFPMDLDKVIFVDADQIVRVDMKELVDVDLQGHVYGYPPMGDDRTEMEGFRFWKTGYWREALHGKPYHISALYVVDLKRFRQLATGDRLRSQYHALSADPNSLANLDQDLPNSMQDSIPIFTLEQDWLWCQTWCSDESLATAKTIDLCQNPLTKEPKLKRARQIPEWDSYDREIAAFAARISGNEGALAASVDDLAGSKEVVEESEVDVTEDVQGEQVKEETEHHGRIEGEL